MRILDYLSENGVDFTVRHHEEYFTASQEAQAQHISGSMFAKTVVVKSGNEYVMLVLPASYRVDMDSIQALLDGKAHLATEPEMGQLFPDCELGAEPPFGSQYGLRTIVDAHLAQQEIIAVRAGSHKEVVILPFTEYARIETPRVASFGEKAA